MNWKNYAKETEAHGIKMRLIGGWMDLAAYYAGSDGNAWSYQSGWSNCGPLAEFIKNGKLARVRGELLPNAVNS